MEIAVRLPDNDGTAGVLLFVVTMPLSWLATMIPSDVPQTQISILTVAGPFQASTLG